MALSIASRRQTGRMPQTPTRRMGAWKLAYADFMTALVALFLVLWLVKGLPATGRGDIASYFRDEAPPSIAMLQNAYDTSHAAASFSQTIAEAGLQERVQVHAHAKTIRVDIVDRRDSPVFATGETVFTDAGREILSKLSNIATSNPWSIDIEGHTDAFPTGAGQPDNWELSTLRANAARQLLMENGLHSERIRSVQGYADTRPILPAEPHHATNRRVSLVLHVNE